MFHGEQSLWGLECALKTGDTCGFYLWCPAIRDASRCISEVCQEAVLGLVAGEAFAEINREITISKGLAAPWGPKY